MTIRAEETGGYFFKPLGASFSLESGFVAQGATPGLIRRKKSFSLDRTCAWPPGWWGSRHGVQSLIPPGSILKVPPQSLQ